MDIMESSAFDSFGKKVGGKKRFLVQKESLGFEPLNPKPKISLSLSTVSSVLLFVSSERTKMCSGS